MSGERSEREQSKDAGYEQRPAPTPPARKPKPDGGLFSQSSILQSMELLGDLPDDPLVWNAETAQSADVKANGGWASTARRAPKAPRRAPAVKPDAARDDWAPPPDTGDDEPGQGTESSRRLAADFRSAAEVRLQRITRAREGIARALAAVEGEARSALQALVARRRALITEAFAEAAAAIDAPADGARSAIRGAHDSAGGAIRGEAQSAHDAVTARIEEDPDGGARALAELDRQARRALDGVGGVRDTQHAAIDDSVTWARDALAAAEADGLAAFDALAALHGGRIGRAVESRRRQAEAALGAFLGQWSGHVRDAVERIAGGRVDRPADVAEGLSGLDGLAEAAEHYAAGTAAACRAALESVLSDIEAALDRAVTGARDAAGRIVDGARAAFDSAVSRAREESGRQVAGHRAIARRLARDG